jgi:hypothetical protein
MANLGDGRDRRVKPGKPGDDGCWCVDFIATCSSGFRLTANREKL